MRKYIFIFDDKNSRKSPIYWLVGFYSLRDTRMQVQSNPGPCRWATSLVFNMFIFSKPDKDDVTIETIRLQQFCTVGVFKADAPSQDQRPIHCSGSQNEPHPWLPELLVANCSCEVLFKWQFCVVETASRWHDLVVTRNFPCFTFFSKNTNCVFNISAIGYNYFTNTISVGAILADITYMALS